MWCLASPTPPTPGSLSVCTWMNCGLPLACLVSHSEWLSSPCQQSSMPCVCPVDLEQWHFKAITGTLPFLAYLSHCVSPRTQAGACIRPREG